MHSTNFHAWVLGTQLKWREWLGFNYAILIPPLQLPFNHSLPRPQSPCNNNRTPASPTTTPPPTHPDLEIVYHAVSLIVYNDFQVFKLLITISNLTKYSCYCVYIHIYTHTHRPHRTRLGALGLQRTADRVERHATSHFLHTPPTTPSFVISL